MLLTLGLLCMNFNALMEGLCKTRSIADGSVRHVHSPRLTDHGHLDLAGVLEPALDLAGDLVAEQGGGVVVDLLRLDHYPHLAAGLHGVHPVDAALGARDLLQRLEPLDVVLQALAAASGP